MHRTLAQQAPAGSGSYSPAHHERHERRGRRLCTLAGSACLLFGAACSHGSSAGPEPGTSARAFAAAVADERYEEAYGWMARDLRARLSLAEFRALIEGNPAEARQLVRALLRRPAQAEQWATLAYGDRQSLRLVREPGGWRIATRVVDFYPQSSPRAALRTFIRAMRRKRYGVVLRLVPNALKGGINTQEMKAAWEGENRDDTQRLLSNPSENLDNPIEQVGNHATMAYGQSKSVTFQREDGRWKIVDLD